MIMRRKERNINVFIRAFFYDTCIFRAFKENAFLTSFCQDLGETSEESKFIRGKRIIFLPRKRINKGYRMLITIEIKSKRTKRTK